MKKSVQIIGVALVAMLVVSLASQLPAQTGSSDSKNSKSAEKAPQAALLTERGRELVEQLRLLRRSRENLGSKHPTLPLINIQIAAIKEQLEAWEPAANPFHPSQTTPQINDYDLRQIVLRLNKRVEMLEKRVSELESK